MDISARDLGITDALAEEFRSQRSSAKFLQQVFKASGFNLADRFIGKDVSLQAGLEKYWAQAQTERGRAAITREWGEKLGDELPQLLDDLQARRRSDLTDSIVFSRLADFQPITKSEVPEPYLNNPNGRTAYMLHTWQLKQLDVLRRDFYDKIRGGEKAQGMKNLIRMSAYLAVSGASVSLIQDFLNNKAMDAPTWSEVLDNMTKNYGWSQYTLDTIKEGKPGEAMAKVVVPPYRVFDDIVSGNPRAWDYIPLVKTFRAYLTDKEEAQKEFNKEQRRLERQHAQERKEAKER